MVMCQFLKIKSLDYTCIQSVLFYTGPFRNLDSQMVAEEITTLHQQVVQLGSVFADVFGAKRVVETIRKRMEKFISYLPLLHAICNPGFTVRHWTLVFLFFLLLN